MRGRRARRARAPRRAGRAWATGTTPEKTAERYRSCRPASAAARLELPLPEIAVFSGDTVRRDAEGFLYFIGRRDEMIKTSGYRVSPTEVEEVLYATKLVGECAAFGVEHARSARRSRWSRRRPAGAETVDVTALLAAVPQPHAGLHGAGRIDVAAGSLPRNPNGKIDRKLLSTQWVERRSQG